MLSKHLIVIITHAIYMVALSVLIQAIQLFTAVPHLFPMIM